MEETAAGLDDSDEDGRIGDFLIFFKVVKGACLHEVLAAMK